MNDLTKKIKTGLKNNPESKKDELIRKAVAAITTAVFIFSGVPVPTSFANSHQTVMNELNQPVSTVTLEQANAAAPATRGSIPSGAAIPADNPLSSPTPEAVPSGWTVAANNANYAFKIEYTGSYSHLKLLDLKTSTEKTLCSVWGGGHYPSRFTGNYDVSPDGSTVFYETTTSGYGVGINLERIRNSEEKLHFRGPLESISFENDGQIAVIVVEDDSEPIKVDLQTFKQLPPEIILQARHVRDVEVLSSTRQIYYLEQNGKNLVIVYNPKTRVYHQYTVPGFDPFTTNTAKSPHTLTVPEGGHYAVITMGNSSTVYTVPLRNIDGEFVRSVRVPGGVARDGVASLVWRTASLADMVMKSGARYTLKVDSFGRSVITPLMLPVPSGWTRATSNANFAFRVQRVGSTERLHIMDLKTGTQKMLLSVGGTRSVSNAYDVSPDGTTVIYGTCSSSKKTANYTYVQRISDPSKKLVLSGTLRSVSYASNGKIAVLVLQKNNSSAITGAWVDLLRLTLLR